MLTIQGKTESGEYFIHSKHYEISELTVQITDKNGNIIFSSVYPPDLSKEDEIENIKKTA